MKKEFKHHMASHCENGAILNLLKYHDITISEPLIWGIGSGLFFTYLPFLKLDNAPVVSYRPVPGAVFKSLCKRMGIKYTIKKYKSPKKAMKELDERLDQGKPTAMVVGAFYLPYFPTPYRFHFNAHNIIAFDKKDDHYMVSDAIMEEPKPISYRDLVRVRFAKGLLKPKGKMYYFDEIPENINLEKAIIQGMKKTIFMMLSVPGPLIGVSGIKYLGKRIRNWPRKYKPKKAARNLGQVVRMQEEIGTGGAGFRFLFAAFLQEAADILKKEELKKLAEEMTKIGDEWRKFAVTAGRIYKQREKMDESFEYASDLLIGIADKEKELFRKLKKAIS